MSNLLQAVNNLQICFHPFYAPTGKLNTENCFKLKTNFKDILIIVDNNFISPICEIAKRGTLRDSTRLQKVALLVTWTKYLGARLTCGMGLLENDTSAISNTTGEENRLTFLHGVENIPAMIWKEIAFGYRDVVPDQYLYKGSAKNTHDYSINDHLLLLSDELAIIKIVELLRTPKLTPIDKYINFMNWYTDTLDIAESIIIYAAMVFANIPHVAQPKKVLSKSFEEVKKGIKNQAWDITYITTWSMLYYNEDSQTCNMFATDDTTQKFIVVNVIPPGQCVKSIYSIFKTKAQREKLSEFEEKKLGKARVRPFENMQENEKVNTVKKLLEKEYRKLQEMC